MAHRTTSIRPLLLCSTLAATVLFVAALLLGAPPVARAVGTLEITSSTGPFAIYDHNMPATSPGVMTVSTEICNTGSDPLADVEVYIGNGTTPGTFPTAMFGGSTYSLELLDETVNGDTSDATRFIGPLAAGACQVVYWQIKYPTPNTDLTGLDLDWTVWGSGDDAGATRTDSEADTVQLRSTLSASANKLTPASYTLDPVGPYGIGQTQELCFIAPDFGVIGNGQGGVNDLSFEPVGTTGFDPDNWRLVMTTADLTTSKCGGATYSYTDRKYFSQIDSGDWDGDGNVEACSANSQQITGEYCYTFVAIGSGSSEVVPYQQASSGNQQKYNGDFGDTGPPTFTTDQGCSIDLTKSADKSNVLSGETLTYTIDYTNATTRTVGSPPVTLTVEDQIPADTTYQANSASCPTGGSCTIYYSSDGTSFSATPPGTVTHLRFVLDGTLAASGSGSFAYSVTVNTNNGVTAPAATSNFGGGPICSSSNTVTTTPVTLAHFAAEPRGGGRLEIVWTTATETGNVGFHLYELTDEGPRRLNARMIPTQGLDSLKPQHYAFQAKGYGGGPLAIEDVALDTSRRMHGPFEPGQAHGAPVDADPIDWPEIQSDMDAALARREARTLWDTALRIDSLRADERLAGAQAGLAQWPLPGGEEAPVPLVQLEVDEDGLYRVSHAELLAAGFDLTGMSTSTLSLTSRGEAVPLRAVGGSKFGPGAFLEFHGQAMDGQYTRTNVYTLSSTKSGAARIGQQYARPSRRTTPASHYLETAELREDKAYSLVAPNGDPWYDQSMLTYTSPRSWTFALEVDELVSAPEAEVLGVEVWGVTNWPGTSPDHHLRIALNGDELGATTFDGLEAQERSFELPEGLVQEGQNELRLTLPGDTGYDFDMVNFEGATIRYPRAFVAREGRLDFESSGRGFLVDGLQSPEVEVYRLTETGPVRLTGVQVTSTARGHAVSFAGNGLPSRYRVVDATARRTPGLRAVRAAADLDASGVDYLMIAHPSFLDGLAPLVQHHEAKGTRVKTVDVLDVYAQHGDGIFGPEAIRSYIAEAAAQGVRSVLLVGGDTTDYLDRLGLGSISFIPTLYGRTDEIVAFAPLDPLFADVNDDGVPDELGLGRLPVRTAQELDTLVAKLLAYASKDYERSAVLAADLADPSVSFTADSERFAAGLGEDWELTRAYLDKVGVAEARQRLLDKLNEGVALTSYVGHSGPTAWSFSGLFNANDAAALTNAGRPTVVAQWGCWNTYHVSPAYNTLGHRFLLSGDRGAASVLGASTLTQARSEQLLGHELMPRLAQPGVTLGQAIADAKRSLAADEPDLVDVLYGWTLLGDPEALVQP